MHQFLDAGLPAQRESITIRTEQEPFREGLEVKRRPGSPDALAVILRVMGDPRV